MRAGSSRPSPAPGTDSTPSRGPAVDARSSSPTTVHVNSRIAAGGEASEWWGGGGGSDEKERSAARLVFLSRTRSKFHNDDLPARHTSPRTGGALRPRESLAAMEELQRVRSHARGGVRPGLFYHAAGPRSIVACCCPNSPRASPVAERRADPSRLSCPPQAKRERLEQMRKMGIGKFQKVRYARLASPLESSGRVRSADARRGHPSRASRPRAKSLEV